MMKKKYPSPKQQEYTKIVLVKFGFALTLTPFADKLMAIFFFSKFDEE